MAEKEHPVLLGRLEEEAKECVYSHDYEMLSEIGERVVASTNLVGSADDFHNFAVNFAQTDDKIMACEILKRGLDKYPRSVDLLADFLQYGMECGEILLCKKHYEELQLIPKNIWTWRGFDFSLDYLQSLLDIASDANEYEQIKQEMDDLVAEFKKHLPFEERCYLAESKLHKNSEKEIEILETAMTQLKACPKCALRYADIQCDRGEYKNALEGVKRCLTSLQTQAGINEGYAYFLSGLCQAALVHAENSYEDSEKIKNIYQDFHVAEMDGMKLPPTYKKTIKRQTSILKVKSGVLYSDDEDSE